MKPILFNTDMVRAILEDRKTVTRRVVEIQNVTMSKTVDRVCVTNLVAHFSWSWAEDFAGFDVKKPYRPGDILYVRETWNYGYCDTTDFEFRYNETFFEELKPGSYKDSYLMPRYFYRTDDLDGIVGIKWRPSIHMPREAARIFLRVTNVTAERLRECGKGWCLDIEKEGVVTPQDPILYIDDDAFHEALKEEFQKVWDSTIKPADRTLYGWDSNPYVWVIEFERISKEEAMKDDQH